jgi:hypothetical protein
MNDRRAVYDVYNYENVTSLWQWTPDWKRQLGNNELNEQWNVNSRAASYEIFRSTSVEIVLN